MSERRPRKKLTPERIDAILDVIIELAEGLTARERACLEFLEARGKDEATAQEIGEAIRAKVPGCRPNSVGLGASVCGILRKKRLVLHLGDVNAWRIGMGGIYVLNGVRALERRAKQKNGVP
jgi:hypothetical protein